MMARALIEFLRANLSSEKIRKCIANYTIMIFAAVLISQMDLAISKRIYGNVYKPHRETS